MFISLSKQNKENVGCFLVDTVFRQEHKKHGELLPHIGPLPIVIPLKLFLERIGFPADNISSRVAWTFRGERKCMPKHVGIPRECGSWMNAKQGFILS